MNELTRKQRLAAYEAEHKLFHRTYNGAPYWYYLRFEEFEEACVNGLTSKKRAANRSVGPVEQYLRPTFGAAARAARERFGGDGFRQADLLMVLNSRSADGPVKKSRQLEYFTLPQGISCCKLFNLPRYDTADLDLDAGEHTMAAAFFLARQARLWQKVRRPARDEAEFAFLQWLAGDIGEKFGRSLSAEAMEQEIVGFQCWRAVYRKVYQRILDAVRPRAIALICYYSRENLFLIELARERNIPVIEMMHGVVRNHQSYYFVDPHERNVFVPDYFLTFGKWQTQWCRFQARTRAVDTGYPYRDEIVQRYQDTPCEERAVVFYPNANEACERFIAGFAALAVPRGWKVVCKLHPNQCRGWQSFYPVLSGCAGIEMIDDPACNVYRCLFGAKHHVFLDTTVIYEAAPIPGRRIYVMGIAPHPQAQPFIDEGMAAEVMTPEALLAAVEAPAPDSAAAAAGIWKPNGRQNVERFFAEMAAQGWPMPKAFQEDRM